MWHPLSASARRPAGPSRTRRKPSRPLLESLERRTVMSVAFESVLTVGDSASDLTPTDSAVDASGNTYVTGILRAPMDFDPSVDRPDGSDVLVPRGTSDAYVVKYNADNSFAWARALGGDHVRPAGVGEFERGNGIRVDAAGNVLVTGNFFGQADFGPFRLTSAGDADAFVVKIAPGGEVLWAKGWGGAGQDVGNDVAVDAAGDVVAVGASAYADASAGWIQNTSQVWKFNAGGAAVWSRSFAGPTHAARAVATDAAGNVLVGGRFSGTVDFNPDPKKTNSLTGSYGSGYVLKLTPAGAFGWASPFATRPTSSPNGSALTINDLAVDSAGNVAVVGNFQGEVDFNPSAQVDLRLPAARAVNGFVVRLASSGSLAWARHAGADASNKVSVDGAGAVYVAGHFLGAAGFDPGFGRPVVPSNGAADAYLSKYTAAGALSWSATFGGAKGDVIYGLAVTSSGAIHLAGASNSGSIDYDPNPLTTRERTNAAFNDLFLLKLRQA